MSDIEILKHIRDEGIPLEKRDGIVIEIPFGTWKAAAIRASEVEREGETEVERLRRERDEAREIAVNLYRFLAHHEATPEIDESYGWLIYAVVKERQQ